MGKTATIQMNGEEYKLHPFNIKEMKEVARLFAANEPDMAIRVVEIALRRAEPAIADMEAFEPGIDLNEISKVVLELSGFKTQNPPQAVPPTAS